MAAAASGLGVKAAPFTYAAHALAAAAAVMVLVWCIRFRGGLALEAENKNLIFNVHPVLMLIGYIILGSEAIMIYKIFPNWNHDTAKLTHLILHAIATVLGAFGIYCAFKFHNDSGIANLYSLHSWLGIGTISLYGVQWVFGFVTFFFPGAAPSVRRGVLPWHALFGLFVYFLALATAELGFLEKLTFLQSGGLDKYGAEAFLVNFTALVVVLFGAAVVVAAVAPAHVNEEPQGYAPIPVHPVLMLIGYIILGSEAIMIYKVFPDWDHDTAKLTHLILHGIATVLGAFGIYCAFKFHNESAIANMHSLHSWLGIGTISLYGVQWVFGLVTFFFPGAAPSVRRSALPWHALFGLFVYILALATAELGFLEKLTFLQSGGLDKYGAEAFLVNFTALVVVLFGAVVVVAAIAPADVEEERKGYDPLRED